MPITSFTPARTFTWPPPPEPVCAPAPPPTAEDLARAAGRLLAAFGRLREQNPRAWRLSIAGASGFSGQTPEGGYGCWWFLTSREVREEPRVFFSATPDEVPGLADVARALLRCRVLVKRTGPAAAGARFVQLLGLILRARWAAGPFTPAAAGSHRIAVSYPLEPLDQLRAWAERPPGRVGRKANPNGRLIAKRADELQAAGAVWKDIAAEINTEFGVLLKSGSLRKKWERWKRSENRGTE